MNSSEDSYDTDNYTYMYVDSCENRHDPNSFDNLFRFIVNSILMNFFGLIGILGNIISMIILSRPQMRSSINYLLIGLARCDIVLILTSILMFGLPGIYTYTGYMFEYYYHVYPLISPYLFPIAIVAQTVSVYITLTVTIERYVAVCHPLRARSLCTYGRARWYVLIVVIFSFIYNIPRFFEVDFEPVESDRFNTTIYCVKATEFRRNEIYITVYIHWMYSVFMYFLPFSALVMFNIAIYKQVRKANAERQKLSRLQRREIGLATMLLWVVAVFLFCNILALVTNTLETFYKNEELMSKLDPLIQTSNFLITTNSCVNFIIYVIFGEKFKRLFFKIFCTRKFLVGSGRESPDGATQDSFVSNGDTRYSMRISRQNTVNSRNGDTLISNGSRRSVRFSKIPNHFDVIP